MCVFVGIGTVASGFGSGYGCGSYLRCVVRCWVESVEVAELDLVRDWRRDCADLRVGLCMFTRRRRRWWWRCTVTLDIR